MQTLDLVRDTPDRIQTTDRLPVPLRALVSSYGETAVQAFLDVGITKPQTIHRLIRASRQDVTPRDGTLVLGSTEPTETMIQASIREIPIKAPGERQMPAREKAIRRLRAALQAEASKRS
jgi:hypothetical protein